MIHNIHKENPARKDLVCSCLIVCESLSLLFRLHKICRPRNNLTLLTVDQSRIITPLTQRVTDYLAGRSFGSSFGRSKILFSVVGALKIL